MMDDKWSTTTTLKEDLGTARKLGRDSGISNDPIVVGPEAHRRLCNEKIIIVSTPDEAAKLRTRLAPADSALRKLDEADDFCQGPLGVPYEPDGGDK